MVIIGVARGNASDKKYIFRNSQSMEEGAGEELLGSSSQWNGKITTDGTETPWTIKAFIANGGSPPANSIFMGITFSMAFGKAGDVAKTPSLSHRKPWYHYQACKRYDAG